jgi:hypothetical protein
LVDALSLYLPDSAIYPTLSTLPAPDLTNPTDSTTASSQAAIYNSLPVLEEIVSLNEADETETLDKEIDNRRKRLNAGSPRSVRNEVIREVYGSSKVYGTLYIPFAPSYSPITISCLIYTMKFSTTPILRMSFDVRRNRSNFAESEITFFLYLWMTP